MQRADISTKDIPPDKQEQLLSDTKPIHQYNIEKTMNSTTHTETPEMPDHLLDNSSADDIDHTPLTFGKYKGQTPDEVSAHDPHWLVWAHNNVTNKVTCSLLLANECAKQPKTFIRR